MKSKMTRERADVDGLVSALNYEIRMKCAYLKLLFFLFEWCTHR